MTVVLNRRQWYNEYPQVKIDKWKNPNTDRLTDKSSQNSTVSGWFQYNREPLEQDIQLARLPQMDCRGGCTKPKPALEKHSTLKEQLSSKAIDPRLFESQYTCTETQKAKQILGHEIQ